MKIIFAIAALALSTSAQAEWIVGSQVSPMSDKTLVTAVNRGDGAKLILYCKSSRPKDLFGEFQFDDFLTVYDGKAHRFDYRVDDQPRVKDHISWYYDRRTVSPDSATTFENFLKMILSGATLRAQARQTHEGNPENGPIATFDLGGTAKAVEEVRQKCASAAQKAEKTN